MESGIEALNIYGGAAFIEVGELFEARSLDMERFDNLMMNQTAAGLPCEDAVTNAVNAAKPIVDALSEEEKSRIELVISASESAVDFGKALAAYIHDYLGLARGCRLFELKQACYAGTAALQMANGFVASQASPGAKALVIATDTARAAHQTYAEASQSTGAAAILVGENPRVLEIDLGAAGYHSYEVMDVCRPLPDLETGSPDLSLLSYLDCLENSCQNYLQKVKGSDFKNTFDYLAFHTPFAGLVKGGHRKLMRKWVTKDFKAIEADFEARMTPSLHFCRQVGNLYSASLYTALAGLIDQAPLTDFQRVGLFSYGSGCSSEFYSGLISSLSKEAMAEVNIQEQLDRRRRLTIEEYDYIISLNMEWMFGVKDKTVDFSKFSSVYEESMAGRGLLTLREVKDYHRKYDWS